MTSNWPGPNAAGAPLPDPGYDASQRVHTLEAQWAVVDYGTNAVGAFNLALDAFAIAEAGTNAAAVAQASAGVAQSRADAAYAIAVSGTLDTAVVARADAAYALAESGTRTAEPAFVIAVAGTSVGNAALLVAASGTRTAVAAYALAESGTRTAEPAFVIAVAGTSVGNAALLVAASGTRTAVAAFALASVGTNTGTAAYNLAVSGTNRANAAFSIACIGTNTGTAAYTLATTGSNLAWSAYTLASTAVSGGVPIGSIAAWYKGQTGVSALDANWVECNGQVLSDASSPMNGQTMPNLNGGSGNLFLRGNSTSGSLGGSATHTHTLSGVTEANAGSSGIYAFTDSSPSVTTVNNEPPYMDVVWIIRVKEGTESTPDYSAGGTMTGNLAVPNVLLSHGTYGYAGTRSYSFLGEAMQETTVNGNFTILTRDHRNGAEIALHLRNTGAIRTLAFTGSTITWYGTGAPVQIYNKDITVALLCLNGSILGASMTQL